jgi:hypothetical protein
MIDLRFRPLTRWIGDKTKSWNRAKPNFSATYARLLDDLEADLTHLKAKNATVEAGFRDDQIRNDGWPYANAAPSEPGVILSFDSKYGPLALPCDYFLHWQQNLRAIGLHLQHLRLATAYGVGSKGEQYKGWKAIEAPGQAGMSPEAAAAHIANLSSYPNNPAQLFLDYKLYRRAYRAAALRVHPDQAGQSEGWTKLCEATAILDQHFKGREGRATA